MAGARWGARLHSLGPTSPAGGQRMQRPGAVDTQHAAQRAELAPVQPEQAPEQAPEQPEQAPEQPEQAPEQPEQAAEQPEQAAEQADQAPVQAKQHLCKLTKHVREWSDASLGSTKEDSTQLADWVLPDWRVAANTLGGQPGYLMVVSIATEAPDAPVQDVCCP